MISLNENPEAVFTMNKGDESTLDGRKFTFDVLPIEHDRGEEVFLTEVGSRIDEYNKIAGRGLGVRYEDYITHVRHPQFSAAMTRKKLHEILVAGTYRIE